MLSFFWLTTLYLIVTSFIFIKELKHFPTLILSFIRWSSFRITYLSNNWFYTTNHKRIGVNYFGFIVVSGTAGMSLASVMRVEFAYPGVSILFGDSLQYLTFSSGHGVIMVFFMIMPVLFGAFANFLLPTQLGVHDVAFPRLNSAAFWFLPGGLILLCHTICVDRRYQRLNFFNIREFQTLLKRKHFKDLVNTTNHTELLDDAIIKLRYKMYHSVNKDSTIHLFYKYNTVSSNQNRFIMLENNNSNGLLTSNLNITSNLVNKLSTYNLFNLLFQLVSDLVSYITDLLRLVGLPIDYISSIYISITNLFINIYYFFSTLNINNLLINWFSSNLNSIFTFNSLFTSYKTTSLLNNSSNSYNVTNLSLVDERNQNLFSNLEDSDSFRALSHNIPRIGIDFKFGFYNKCWKSYPQLFITEGETKVLKNVLKGSWVFSNNSQLDYDKTINGFYHSFTDLFDETYRLWLRYIDEFKKTGRWNPPVFKDVVRPRWSQVSGDHGSDRRFESSTLLPIDAFFNLYQTNNYISNNLNIRWTAFANLDQKFYKMFNTNSTQQRLLSKWRELKFTREAWRCKLLISRNQNSLFKRHYDEEGYILKMYRNARDLIPGWAMITPFSGRPRYTVIGRTDMGLAAVFLALNASIISSANFLVTYRYLSTLNNRKMRDARSFFSESIIVASWMMVAANPMLAIGILMLISDRHWRTSFFDFSGGGDAVLFQHMFWFFGHPEVYVIMIPVFGFANTLLSFYLRKRISARASLLYSMYTIAFLGFWVWGHHMYMVGLSHTTRMLFSTLTVMISVPAATKLMHWCVTLVNSAFIVEIPLLYTLVFIFFFVSGGISGMAVAHTGMDVLFHDTFYVIGHFHVMLAGAGMLGIFGAFYFYFPAIYGVRYSRIYAYIHFVYYLFGQLLTVIPMMWLGYCGMPRRVMDYPFVLGGWHSIATSGHSLSVAAILAFFIMIYDSIRQAKPAIRKTFGPSRFNTRLNFFLYENYRLSYIQRRSFYMKRNYSKPITSGRNLDYLRLANSESTLFSYSFIK